VLVSNWKRTELQLDTSRASASDIWETIDKSAVSTLLERATPQSTAIAVQMDAEVAVSVAKIDTAIPEPVDGVVLEGISPTRSSNGEHLIIRLPQGTPAFERARKQGKSVDVLMVHVAPEAAATLHTRLDVEGESSLASGLYSVAMRVNGEAVDSNFDATVPWRLNYLVRSFGEGRHEFSCKAVSTRGQCSAAKWDGDYLTCSCLGKGAQFASVWEGPRTVKARRLSEIGPQGIPIEIPASFMFAFPDIGHIAAVFLPLASLVLIVFAALNHWSNPEKEADLSAFCVTSDVPIIHVYYHPLASLVWLRSPRADSNFGALQILGKIRLARRSQSPVHDTSLYAFLKFKCGFPGMLRRVIYRDHPLSWLWISLPWSTRYALCAKLVTTFSLTIGFVALRHVLSGENLPSVLEEMKTDGLPIAILYEKIFTYDLDSDRWYDAFIITITGKIIGVIFELTVSPLFI
jgi:hypothetical protein